MRSRNLRGMTVKGLVTGCAFICFDYNKGIFSSCYLTWILKIITGFRSHLSMLLN